MQGLFTVYRRRLTSIGYVLLVLCLCLPTAFAEDEDAGRFLVDRATTRLVAEVYHLDAWVDFNLSASAQQALENGVPLVLEIQIQVLQQQNWRWDPEVAYLAQRYRLHYHALTHLFLVVNLNTNEQTSYRRLSSALIAIGDIRDLPMLDKRLLEPKEKYWVRLRGVLDIESLPTPLRLWAYATPQWRIKSEWYAWPL